MFFLITLKTMTKHTRGQSRFARDCGEHKALVVSFLAVAAVAVAIVAFLVV